MRLVFTAIHKCSDIVDTNSYNPDLAENTLTLWKCSNLAAHQILIVNAKRATYWLLASIHLSYNLILVNRLLCYKYAQKWIARILFLSNYVTPYILVDSLVCLVLLSWPIAILKFRHACWPNWLGQLGKEWDQLRLILRQTVLRRMPRIETKHMKALFLNRA